MAARDGRARLTEDEVVASAVLLLNAGHEASVNVFGNGLVAMLQRGLHPDEDAVDLCVEEMLRYDSALQLFERTATSDVEVGGVQSVEGQKVAALLGAANRDPATFDRPDEFDVRPRPQPAPRVRGGFAFLPGGAAGPDGTGRVRLVAVGPFPGLRLAGEPESRGTFVLRGYHSVPVRG